jgi:AcrR family transcriptional regulator
MCFSAGADSAPPGPGVRGTVGGGGYPRDMALPGNPPVSRDDRAAVSPSAVVDAALTVFAERGYHGTSVKEIAALLRIRTPSLYNHMTSKQSLLEEIIGSTSRQVWADFEAAVEGKDDVTVRLHDAVYVYALRHATRRREAVVVNRDISSIEEPARTEILELRRRHEHAVRALVQEGIEKDVFMDQPASLVSFAILEMCVSIARWFHPGLAFTAEDVAEHYSRYALRIARGEQGVSGSGPAPS